MNWTKEVLSRVFFIAGTYVFLRKRVINDEIRN